MKTTGNQFDREWDVMIVGAGPAGLFAALGIASTSDKGVLIVDAGPGIDERLQLISQIGGEPRDGSVYLRGVGGAGLFSDGKLCLSLDVGGHLKTALDDARKNQILQVIARLFGLLLQSAETTHASEQEIAAARNAAGAVRLEFKYYPVFHIGTERCAEVIASLTDLLVARGVTLATNCELTDVRELEGGLKETTIIRHGERQTIRARAVILCMGKVGASTEQRICEKLGISSVRRPMYIGVRVESDEERLKPLFNLAKDPKYSLLFADGSKVKTHCASDGGQVMALNYEGLPLAGGQSFKRLKTGRSSFSVLWDGIQFLDNSYQAALSIMSDINAQTHGSLLVQRLIDYKAKSPSLRADLETLNLSNRRCEPGNVREFLPTEYFDKFDLFLERLTHLAPGILSDRTVLYAPAIEWWMNRIEVVNRSMETTRHGVYVCGDGSGWSQGIVHSAATALLVAEGITGTLLSEPLMLGFMGELDESWRTVAIRDGNTYAKPRA